MVRARTFGVTITVFLVLFAAVGSAYDIKGRVVDLVFQSGIDKVNVNFYSMDGKLIDKTETDGKGEFRKEIHPSYKQFKVSYLKQDGGPEGAGYEGYARPHPIDNNVKTKDVDTVALRPRRKNPEATSPEEKEEIVKNWLLYFFVTKDQVRAKKAFEYYSIDDASVMKGAARLESEMGKPIPREATKTLLQQPGRSG